MQPAAARVGRRTFLKQAGGLGATMLVGACSKDSWLARRRPLAEDTWIYGYPIVATVTSGGTLDLAYLTNQTSFVVRLWRWGSTPTLIYTSPTFAVTAAGVERA